MLNQKEKNILLKIARGALENYFEEKSYIYKSRLTKNLKKNLGAFVTLKNKDNLKGCIGYTSSDDPLYKTVSDLAKQAAFNDSRFNKLTSNELAKIKIEISVLTEPKKINSVKEIELGRHGVIIEQGHKKGLFLPQVATENSWDLKTFMDYLCEHKAGIPKEDWKNGKADIYTFEAIVFSE
jgi:AmmeMemoRadiSam system protein A